MALPRLHLPQRRDVRKLRRLPGAAAEGGAATAAAEAAGAAGAGAAHREAAAARRRDAVGRVRRRGPGRAAADGKTTTSTAAARLAGHDRRRAGAAALRSEWRRLCDKPANGVFSLSAVAGASDDESEGDAPAGVFSLAQVAASDSDDDAPPAGRFDAWARPPSQDSVEPVEADDAIGGGRPLGIGVPSGFLQIEEEIFLVD